MRRYRSLRSQVATAVTLLGLVAVACAPASAPAPTAAPSKPAETKPAAPAAAKPTEAAKPAAEAKPAPAKPAEAAKPASGGGTLRVGIGAYPHSFNPNLSRSAPAYSFYAAVMDSLTYADSTKGGQLGPRLATEWRLVNDTTWQFKLRQGVKWHDGSEFTADDVVATMDLALKGTPPAQYANRIAGVTKTEAVDKYTVNFTTETKNALLPTGLSDIYIYQAKQIKEGGNDAVNANPLGTGAFKYTSREEGVSVTITRFPDYWGEKPKLEQIVFKGFPEDATRVAALESGEIDIAFNVPPDDAKRLESKGIQIAWTPIGQAMMLHFKMVDPQSPLAKREVRQALNHAIDNDGLIQGVMLGYGEKLRGQIVGPDAFGYNDALQPYAYDPAKAKQLLAQAGYPNGFPITFSTSQGRYAKQKEVSEALAAQMKAVGIDVRTDFIEWGAFITAMPDLTLAYIGWNYFPSMDADFVTQHFICASRYKIMCNQEYDELHKQQRSEADPARRVAMLKQMQKILHDEAAAGFTYQSPDIFGVGKRVQGFKPTPDNVAHFDTITVQD